MLTEMGEGLDVMGGVTTTSKAADILVVDDDAGVRRFLVDLLRAEGHRVEAVESGEAALEQIAIREFDLALVDLKMEDVGGIDVLTALREQSPDTVDIILTGHGSLSTAVEAIRLSAHDYLLKRQREKPAHQTRRVDIAGKHNAHRFV